LGFSRNNRRIDISYSIDDVKAIRVELKDGLSPRRTIYLCVKGQREIPLTRVGQPMTLEKLKRKQVGSIFTKDLLLNSSYV
jgi:hypothetical protein